MNQNKILSGIKVVEMSTYIAGPSCARILADWGAEVIKVETPKGDAWRYIAAGLVTDEADPVFASDNANKKFAAIDLKVPEGADVLKSLLKGADVFITNLRPNALEKSGLSYDNLKKMNERLIYALATGYGLEGPAKDHPGYDTTAFFSRGGISVCFGQKDGVPSNPGAGFGDHVLGTNLACGILAALYNREKTGKGDFVNSSLLQSSIYLISSMMGLVQVGASFPNSRMNPPNALNNTYQCSDGRWIMLAGASWALYLPKFCEITGHRDEFSANEEYLSPIAGLIYGEELSKMVSDIMITKTRDEWIKIFTAADFPHEALQDISDIMQDEQAYANRFVFKHEFADGSSAVYSNTPVFFESQPITDFVHSSPIGANTEEILKKAGYSDEMIETLAAKGAIVK
ncbi:MAG: CoA transferase [Oscillospiraceae bacterium]|nr:CoA transferase [Oscillospiraceae bacterium]